MIWALLLFALNPLFAIPAQAQSGCTSTVSGYTFKDRNSDGIYNQGDEGIKGVEVRISPHDVSKGDVFVLSNNQGFWTAVVCEGTYTVTVNTARLGNIYNLISENSRRISLGQADRQVSLQFLFEQTDAINNSPEPIYLEPLDQATSVAVWVIMFGIVLLAFILLLMYLGKRSYLLEKVAEADQLPPGEDLTQTT